MKGRTEEGRIFNDNIDAVKVRAYKNYYEFLSAKEKVLASDLRDAILGINTAKI